MKENTTNIEQIKKYGFWILIIFTALETIFYFSLENIMGCIVFLYAWLLLSKIVLFKKNFELCLLPTLGVCGFIFCYYFLPLIATFIEGKPLTYNFQVANITFFNMFLNITTVISAYKLCISKYRHGNYIERVWRRIGLFTAPTENQIWLFGIIGCIMLFIGLLSQSNPLEFEEMEVGTNLKTVVMNIFKAYASMPICFFFCGLYGYKKTIHKKKFIIPFLVILSLIGVATTKRSMIFNAFASLGIIYTFVVVYYDKKVLTKRNMFISIVTIYLITGPIADLALAMALNRLNMDNGINTFEKVLDIYKDKDKMRVLKMAQKMITNNDGDNRLSWSEEYVDNIFLDRFCNIRVLDSSVFYAGELGYNNPKMHEYFKEEIVNRLPSPIVSLIGEHKVVHTTVADEMNNAYFNPDGKFWAGYKVSGDIGVGLYTFGYAYYPIAFIIYLLTFMLLSTYTTFFYSKFLIPTIILTHFYQRFVYFDNALGIYTSIGELMRGWTEIVIFCVIFKFIRTIIK